jgi:hypothetical protein
MVEFSKKQIKDIGLDKEVMEALPYAVVGGAYEGSLSSPLVGDLYRVLLSHIVPTGHQLKILFLRIWTQEATGARFSIVQTNPTLAGQTGTVEAFPVVGSVPQGVRDYPMLEAPGAEVLHGSLVDPIHVLEGSIDFRLLGATPTPATGDRYSLTWWGVEKFSER